MLVVAIVDQEFQGREPDRQRDGLVGETAEVDILLNVGKCRIGSVLINNVPNDFPVADTDIIVILIN